MRAISPTAAGITDGNSSPDNHLASAPHCSVIVATAGRIESARSHPGVYARIIPTPGVKTIRAAHLTSPDNHIASTPNGAVKGSGVGRIGDAGCDPTIQLWIISAAGVEVVRNAIEKIPSPNDHFTASPDGCVRCPPTRRVGCACRNPAIHHRIVSASGLVKEPIPNDHLASRPNCSVRISRTGRISNRGSCPTVCVGIVPPAGVQGHGKRICIRSSPNYHFATGPHCCVILPASRRIGDTSS